MRTAGKWAGVQAQYEEPKLITELYSAFMPPQAADAQSRMP